jgi:tRNA(Arg) A34 adenosine deaminase TadA
MEPTTQDHERFMRRAIAQASDVPQLPFGAVLVNWDTGEVVAAGHNRSAENPTLHGEMDVIGRCALTRPGIDWSRLALYTTAEPCPMCAAAAVWARLRAVVFGTSIPTLQQRGWLQIDLRAEEVFRRAAGRECVLIGGVLEAECDALFGPPPGGYTATRVST